MTASVTQNSVFNAENFNKAAKVITAVGVAATLTLAAAATAVALTIIFAPAAIPALTALGSLAFVVLFTPAVGTFIVTAVLATIAKIAALLKKVDANEATGTDAAGTATATADAAPAAADTAPAAADTATGTDAPAPATAAPTTHAATEANPSALPQKKVATNIRIGGEFYPIQAQEALIERDENLGRVVNLNSDFNYATVITEKSICFCFRKDNQLFTAAIQRAKVEESVNVQQLEVFHGIVGQKDGDQLVGRKNITPMGLISGNLLTKEEAEFFSAFNVRK